jgi:hypothetical protein
MRYWELASLQEKVQFHSDMNFGCSDKELVIMDEADLLLYSNPLSFFSRLDEYQIICFTATIGDYKIEKQENEILKEHQFEVF